MANSRNMQKPDKIKYTTKQFAFVGTISKVKFTLEQGTKAQGGGGVDV
jgi:hypothetical protein